MESRNHIAIIGAGPAGVAAAVQLRRFGSNLLLFEQTRVGGLINNAYLIENYPGFPQGISGIEFAKKLTQHLSKWRINVIKERVIEVIQKEDDFILRTNKSYRAEILVVASGTKPKLPGLDINNLPGRIFFEVYPIQNRKSKKVVIIGAGDAALDYALNLSRNNKVTIINRNKNIEGLELLFKRIVKFSGKQALRVNYLKNTCIFSIKKLNNNLIIELTTGNKKRELLTCDYLLFAIGREPAIDFLAPSVQCKYPKGDNERIYFIGDVRHGNFRQTAIAVGDGIQAAMKIHQYLQTQKPQD